MDLIVDYGCNTSSRRGVVPGACSVTVKGNVLEVSHSPATYLFGEDDYMINMDCGGIPQARCRTPALAAGEWTARLGDRTLRFAIPNADEASPRCASGTRYSACRVDRSTDPTGRRGMI